MKKLLFLLLLGPFVASAQIPDLSRIQSPPGPSITISPSSLGTISDTSGTPSQPQSITYTFANLTGSNGAIAFPTWMEGSIDAGFTYHSSFSGIASSSGTLLARVTAGTSAGSYGPSNITFSATGAAPNTCSASATVAVAPSLSATPTSLTTNGTAGTAGTPATTTVTWTTTTPLATAPTNTEVSKDGGMTYGATQTLSSGSPLALKIRTKSSAGPGSISGNLVLSGAGVSNFNVGISGTVSSGSTVDTIYINFMDSTSSTSAGTGSIATAGWNNWSVPLSGSASFAGTFSAPFKYSSGANSTVQARFSNTNFFQDNGSGFNSSTSSGMPVGMFRLCVLNTTASDTFNLKGIPSATTSVDIKFFAGRASSTVRHMTLTETISGSTTGSVTVTNATAIDGLLQLTGLTPQASGWLSFKITDDTTFWFADGCVIYLHHP